jgi:hypothetical protein
VRSNRSAIGARVHVVAVDDDGTRRSIHRVIGSGGSFGANPLVAEIGLGKASHVERVSIEWPGSRTRQELPGLAVDTAYQVREPCAERYALNATRAPARAPGLGHAHHHPAH